jgi:hypothetical protein
MQRRSLLFLLLNVIVSLVVVVLAWNWFSSREEQPSSQMVITVPILVTATIDPEATEAVRIITATPLPGQPRVAEIPTGLIDSIDQTRAAAPTINPEVLGADAALQGTVTALPENCILHTLEEGEFPSSIAEQYGANVFELMAVNGLTEESAALLQIGQVLIVPLEGCDLGAVALQSTEAAALAPTLPPTSEATATASGSGATATDSLPPTRPATATLPPTATNAQVAIVQVKDAGDVTAEGVEIRNNGAVVDLTGWTLSDAQGNSYTFPERRLFTGGRLTVYTRVGEDVAIALYWGRDSAVWETGSTLTLRDRDGRVQSTFIVP